VDIVKAFILMDDAKTPLILVGADPLRVDQNLKKIIGFRSNISVQNSTKDLSPFYAASDCLVFASEQETMPLVLQEAVAWNLKRICSRYPGYRELIPSDDFAYLFDVGNIETLKDRMCQVVNEPDLSDEMVTQAFGAQETQHNSSFDLLTATIKSLQAVRTSVHPVSWRHD
jgi:glycosyltransferase involved in cell wall biosynthesis